MTLLVTPVCFEDGPDLIRANQASIDFHRPWTEPFTDAAGFDAWFERCRQETHAGLVAREGDSVVGVINFSEIVRDVFRSAYCGFYGMKDSAGRGLMTGALRAALAHAFGPLDLHRAEANVRPENRRSLALLARVGFRKEGYSPRYLFLDGAWRDHERWALTQEEWR